MPTVMIVEDDRDTLTLLTQLVELETGWHAMAMPSCTEAIRALVQGAHPDVIVFDVMMPEATGNDLLTYVKQHCPKIPAIAVTASPASLTVEGAAGVIRKPFEMDELIGAIGRNLPGRTPGKAN